MPPFLIVLLAHGVLGGIDVVLNHELIARLPARTWAATEQLLHSLRELIFAAIFFSLAWYEWHGWWAWAIVALFAAELMVSIVDTVVEVDTRKLPLTERISHVLLFVNLGLLAALLGSTLMKWAQLPAAIVGAGYGAISWILSAQAGAALLWAVRDGVNVVRRRVPGAHAGFSASIRSRRRRGG